MGVYRILGVYGCYRFFRCLWVSVGVYGYFWVSGCLSESMDVCIDGRYVWMSKGVYGGL